ncbi:DUF6777 domain-containing protein [Streptomyces sp. NPDC089424]|uniref:DUF6777 domain-containing protein n=1 Tax=Streptomyces sp. NPDC089424 TaxID=3365917 RepID=UPI003820A1A7
MAVTVVAAAVGVAVVLIRPGTEPAQAGEVILQPTSSTGPDPYTPSTAKSTSSLPSAAPGTAPAKDNSLRSVAGSEPGLYGGTLNTASCDVEKQIRHLHSDRGKNKAFASVLALREPGVAGYLRALTPVVLRSDTRVTNHGYRDGEATRFQAVLQAGTAVLVDNRGEPKVRCACGNPLTRAVPHKTAPQQKGTPWAGYRPQNVVVVNRSAAEVKEFVILDTQERSWIRRDSGDDGDTDRRTTAPARHWPLPPEPPAKESPDQQSPQDEPGGGEFEPKPEEESEPKPDYDSPEHRPDDPGTKPDEPNKPEEKPDQQKPEQEKPEPKPEKPKEENPKEEKPKEEKPKEEKPKEEKPKEEKPKEEKPKEEKPEHKPQEEEKPQEEQKPKEEHKPPQDQQHEQKPQEEEQKPPEEEQKPPEEEQKPQEEQQPQEEQPPQEEQQPPQEEQQPEQDQDQDQEQQPEQEQQPAPNPNPESGNQG